jgi:hypothetical protein
VLRQHLVAHRKAWASGLIVVSAAIGGLAVSNLWFTTRSAAAESGTVTERVSLGTDNSEGRDSREQDVSTDGRYVAFTTRTPFDPRDGADGPELDNDVYVRDTVAKTLTLISHGGVDNTRGGLGNSEMPAISGDGRFVAFRTNADNVPGPDDNAEVEDPTWRIAVCDRDSDRNGAFDTPCLTVLGSGTEENVRRPQLDEDGRVLTYEVPTPFRPEGDVDGWLVWVGLTSGPTGALAAPTADDRHRVTAPANNELREDYLYALEDQRHSVLSANGRFVVWVAEYRFFGDADGDSGTDTSTVVYNYDRVTNEYHRLDVDSAGNPLPPGDTWYEWPAVDETSMRWAYVDRKLEPYRKELRLFDGNPDNDGRPFWLEGEPLTTEIASRLPDGTVGSGAFPSFSDDGRFLAFATGTPGMHNGIDEGEPNGTCDGTFPTPGRPGRCDVVVRDLALDRARLQAEQPRLPAELASPSIRTTCVGSGPGKPCEGSGHSLWPTMLGDGTAVAFTSLAHDLVDTPEDTNNSWDVFVRHLVPGLAADAQEFGTVEIGATAIREVQIRAEGFGLTRIRELTVQGTDAGDFDVFPSQTCTQNPVYSGGTCTVSVRFKPTTTGIRDAVLRVTSVRGTPLDIPLRGTGQLPPAPGFEAAPATLNFGERGVLHTSPSQPVTIRNNGNAPLQIRAVKLDGTEPIAYPTDYQITANTCADKVIPAGGSCAVSVRHRPVAVGVRPGVLRIDYDGAPVRVSPGPSSSVSASASVSPSGSVRPSTSTSTSASPSASPGVTVPVLTFSAQLLGTGTPATLAAGLKVVPIDDITTLTGANFPPEAEVKIGFEGRPPTATVKTDAQGAFTKPYLVMSQSDEGKRTLRAEVVAGSMPDLSAPVVATTQIMLTRGSLQPPDFVVRN